jgi:uncharacterized radical SAM superfamily Fe-S cluster-containing enzyme
MAQLWYGDWSSDVCSSDLHVFTIVIQDFADAYTMDLDVLHKCCVGQLIPDGRMIPFCAYNSLGYRKKVFTALAAGEMR